MIHISLNSYSTSKIYSSFFKNPQFTHFPRQQLGTTTYTRLFHTISRCKWGELFNNELNKAVQINEIRLAMWNECKIKCGIHYKRG